ncbi:RepB plasmid partition [Rhodoferax sp. AJA081-3]|nr:RepB plasmid partition [Rhodoferax sp. AJA081-3]
MLHDICAEAAGLLKDQHFSANIGGVIRKMKPTRQIECVELMVATNNITVAYAQALLAATPSAMLVGEVKPKKLAGVTSEQMAKMEREMGNLQGQFKSIEQSYGQDVLNLVLAKGYLTKLLDNEAVIRFLTQHQPDVLAEFASIVQAASLDK